MFYEDIYPKNVKMGIDSKRKDGSDTDKERPENLQKDNSSKVREIRRSIRCLG